MSQRRKQSHRRRGPRGQAAQGKATLELWPFAFQDLVDQGRVIWLPDRDVRAVGARLVVHVPPVGDVSIAAPVDGVVTAPARYGFVLHEECAEWTLILGTGANPDAARRNALDELTRIFRDTALTCMRLNPTELPTTVSP